MADKNDKKQPIKWRVLCVDGHDAFLLADQNIEMKSYNASLTAVTWETCTLRSWLNGYASSANIENIDYSCDNFIDEAFTETEQSAIYQTDLVNPDDTYWGTEGGNNTKDKVYLLSYSEAINGDYGFKGPYTSEETLESMNTSCILIYALIDFTHVHI